MQIFSVTLAQAMLMFVHFVKNPDFYAIAIITTLLIVN